MKLVHLYKIVLRKLFWDNQKKKKKKKYKTTLGSTDKKNLSRGNPHTQNYFNQYMVLAVLATEKELGKKRYIYACNNSKHK